MAELTVRNLEDEVKVRLKRRAVANQRSLEAEVREILRAAVASAAAPAEPLGTRMARRFKGLRFEGELPELRGQAATPLSLDDQRSSSTRTSFRR